MATTIQEHTIAAIYSMLNATSFDEVDKIGMEFEAYYNSNRMTCTNKELAILKGGFETLVGLVKVKFGNDPDWIAYINAKNTQQAQENPLLELELALGEAISGAKGTRLDLKEHLPENDYNRLITEVVKGNATVN